MAYGRPARTRSSSRRSSTALRSRPTGTRRGAKKAVTRYKAKTFKKAVRSAMVGQLETKSQFALFWNDNGVYGGGLNAEANVTNMKGRIYPNILSALAIQQGTTSRGRVGDKITPKGLYVNGVVRSLPFDFNSNNSNLPYTVYIIVFKDKLAYNSLESDLKMRCNRTTSPPSDVAIDGSISNEMFPFSSRYQILGSRKFLMKPLAGLSLNNAPTTTTTVQGVQTTIPDFSKFYAAVNQESSSNPCYRRFKFKIPCPKTLVFPNALTNTYTGIPTNHWVSIGAYVIDQSGSPISNNQTRCSVTAMGSLYYTDG